MASVVDHFFSYGDVAPFGKGPSQNEIEAQGTDYLKANFPKIDYIQCCSIVIAKHPALFSLARTNSVLVDGENLEDEMESDKEDTLASPKPSAFDVSAKFRKAADSRRQKELFLAKPPRGPGLLVWIVVAALVFLPGIGLLVYVRSTSKFIKIKS